MEYIPKCPKCDSPLEEVIEETKRDWDYNEKHGTYDQEADYWAEGYLICPRCGADISEYFTKISDFNFIDRTTENGVRRCCAYCQHFNSNNDEEYEQEYPEGVDGLCGLDGSERGDKMRPLTDFDCNKFLLDSLLKEKLDELFVDEEGIIQGC